MGEPIQIDKIICIQYDDLKKKPITGERVRKTTYEDRMIQKRNVRIATCVKMQSLPAPMGKGVSFTLCTYTAYVLINTHHA